MARAAVVLSWLVALAVAGRPGWGTALVGLALVAVWLAPLVTNPRRSRRGEDHHRAG